MYICVFNVLMIYIIIIIFMVSDHKGRVENINIYNIIIIIYVLY